MEFCGGGSVSDIMNTLNTPMTEAQIATICHQALLALAYLHERLKIHRDVKGERMYPLFFNFTVGLHINWHGLLTYQQGAQEM